MVTKIYIPLLGEGVPVVRPAMGQKIKDNIFEVLESKQYDPEDEDWEFVPGSCVKCFWECHGGIQMLVARESIEKGVEPND